METLVCCNLLKKYRLPSRTFLLGIEADMFNSLAPISNWSRVTPENVHVLVLLSYICCSGYHTVLWKVLGEKNVSFQWGVRGTKCLKATMELLIPIMIEMRRGVKDMHWTPEPSSIKRF